MIKYWGIVYSDWDRGAASGSNTGKVYSELDRETASGSNTGGYSEYLGSNQVGQLIN